MTVIADTEGPEGGWDGGEWSETGTHLEHVALHALGALLVLEPALGAEVVGILAKDIPVAMQYPAVASDPGAAGQGVAVELGALGRDEARDVEADGGTHAHRLLETGLQVRQALRLAPRQVARGGDDARRDCLLDLAQHVLVDAGRVEDVPEEGLHG